MSTDKQSDDLTADARHESGQGSEPTTAEEAESNDPRTPPGEQGFKGGGKAGRSGEEEEQSPDPGESIKGGGKAGMSIEVPAELAGQETPREMTDADG